MTNPSKSRTILHIYLPMNKSRILFIFLQVFLFGIFASRVDAKYFQTAGGDVSSNRKLNMVNGIMPANTFLSESSPDTNPVIDSGVILYADSTQFDDGAGSETPTDHNAWSQKLAVNNTISNSLRKYNYDYFYSRLKPINIVNGSGTGYTYSTVTRNLCFTNTSAGTYIYSFKITGYGALNLDCLSNLNVPVGKKIILLVDENVIVKNNITVAPGGFFMVVSNYDIAFYSSINNVQGIFIADEDMITTHPTGSNSTSFLDGKGLFQTHGTLSLSRKIPSQEFEEKFTFDPFLLLSAPKELYEKVGEIVEREP